MSADKIIGFTIEVRGTDSEREKMKLLSNGILDTAKAIEKLKDATDGNIGAQKASADKMAQLELQLKSLKGEYKDTQKAILDNQKSNQLAEGSYNQLVLKNKQLSETLRNLPDAFNPANTAVKEMQKEMFDNTEKLKEFDAAINRNFRNVGNYPQNVNIATASMGELGAAMQEYIAQAQQAKHGSDEWLVALGKAGEAKAKIRELKEETSALDPHRQAAAFVGLGHSIIGGFAAGQAAVKLFGKENEDVMHIIEKMEELQVILMGVKAVQHGLEQAGLVKIILLDKLALAEKEKQIVVTEGATVAQRVLNLVMASNPIGIMIVAITALVALVATYISSTASAERAEKLRNTAIDGTIIKSKELRDAYNESIVTLKEITNSYNVLVGAMTETEAAMDNLKEKNKVALQDISNETKAKLEEETGFWQGAWNTQKDLWHGKLNIAKNMEERQHEIEKEGIDKSNAIKKKEASDLEKIAADADQKMIKDREERLKTLGKSELQIRIDAIRKQSYEEIKNTKYTEEEKTKIRNEAYDEEKRLREEADAKEKADQKQKYDAWKAIEDQRLQTIKENNKKILDLSFQIQEGSINEFEKGAEREIDLSNLKYEKEISNLQDQLIDKKKLSDQEKRINDELNDLIIQKRKEAGAAVVAIVKKTNDEIIALAKSRNDLEEQLAILYVQNSTQSEKDKAVQIRDIRVAAAQKEIDDLNIQGKNVSDAEKIQIEKLKLLITELTKEPVPVEETILAKYIGLGNENSKLLADKTLEIMKSVSDANFNAKKEAVDRASKYELDSLTMENDTKTRMLQSQMDQGLISQAQFNQQKTAQDKIFQDKKKAIEKEAFEKKKELSIKQVIADLAMELMKIAISAAANPANSFTGGIAGILQYAILAGAATANAGIQIGVIKSQKYTLGGLVGGKKHSEGGTQIEAELDESVINANSTRMFAPILSEMNYLGGGKRFATGGIPIQSGSLSSIQNMFSGMSREETAQMIINSLNVQRVEVLENDISMKQKRAQTIDMDSRF